MKPVHHEVRAALLRRIQDLDLDTRLPSDRDLAREFNVASLTINRVMIDLERDGYVERRARKGTYLASHARVVASSDEHRGGNNGVVVFAYPNWFSFHYWRHVRMAEELAVKRGQRLVEYKLNPDSTPERLLEFLGRQADLIGVLMLTVPGSTTPAMLDAFSALGKPVVLLATEIEVVAHRGVYAFDTDWVAAGRQIADHFIAAGHRRLAWLNCEPGRDDRLARGMRDALKAHGLRGSDLTTYGLGTQPWTDARSVGRNLAVRLLDDGIATAAFVDSLAGAKGALRALWERGLRCPEHLSLIVAGSQNGEEDYTTPALTSLDGDWDAEMRWAFAALEERPEISAATWRAPATLVERESVLRRASVPVSSS